MKASDNRFYVKFMQLEIGLFVNSVKRLVFNLRKIPLLVRLSVYLV